MTKASQSFFTITDDDFDHDRNVPDDFLHFLLNDLKDLYWYEKSMLKVVTRMKKVFHSKNSNDMLAAYLVNGNLNIERLEQIFMFFGELPGANKNSIGEDFLNDVNDILLETKEDDSLRNEGLFLMLKKMDESKTGIYENAIASAIRLENHEVNSLLEENRNSALPVNYH